MIERVIFTDLDGTLLDADTYSWEPAIPALRLIEEKGIPLVMVSSKTRLEIEACRDEIGNSHPFIPENGGAIFFPKNYGLEIPPEAVEIGKYRAVVLSRTAAEMVKKFDTLSPKIPVQFVSEMETEQVVELTGLSFEQARSAQAREFGQAFKLTDEGISEQTLEAAVRGIGLNLTRGERFFHLMDQTGKGRAVRVLTELYQRNSPGLTTVGLGNSPNDESFLSVVDKPFLIALSNGGHVQMDIKGLTRVPMAGPAGFNQVILELLA
ncbi:MAG: HAD-IIB family hydrolase [Deltaproteobacteria bacterium]|nr:HAD-IIB family hydrolase [Deltaproteobacteria bacterium]